MNKYRSPFISSKCLGYAEYLRLPYETLVKIEKYYVISKKHSFVG